MSAIYVCNLCSQPAATIEQEALHRTLPPSTQITCWTSGCPNWGKTLDTRDNLNLKGQFTRRRAAIQSIR